VRYLRKLAKGLGFEQKDPTLCFEDIKAAIMTAENECSAAGPMKHVDVKFRSVQERIKLGEMRVRYISAELNWADVLTKAPKKHKDALEKKHKDALEAMIGSKEAYRLTVTQKGVLVQYADSYRHTVPDSYRHTVPKLDSYRHAVPKLDSYRHTVPDSYRHTVPKLLFASLRCIEGFL
jgi:hypothetical protein